MMVQFFASLKEQKLFKEITSDLTTDKQEAGNGKLRVCIAITDKCLTSSMVAKEVNEMEKELVLLLE